VSILLLRLQLCTVFKSFHGSEVPEYESVDVSWRHNASLYNGPTLLGMLLVLRESTGLGNIEMRSSWEIG